MAEYELHLIQWSAVGGRYSCSSSWPLTTTLLVLQQLQLGKGEERERERVSNTIASVEDQEKRTKEETAKGGPVRGGKISLLYTQ